VNGERDGDDRIDVGQVCVDADGTAQRYRMQGIGYRPDLDVAVLRAGRNAVGSGGVDRDGGDNAASAWPVPRASGRPTPVADVVEEQEFGAVSAATPIRCRSAAGSVGSTR
jgi:hypothetical protein